MVNLVRCGAAVVIAIALSVSSISVGAEGNTDSSTDQVEKYAKDLNVSLDEAADRLNLQSTVGELNEKLQENETETFAGMWIEHTPEYRIVVQFTERGEETLSPYMEGSPIAPFIEVQHTDMSYAELVEMQLDVIEMFDSQHLTFDADISIEDNQIQMYVTQQTTDKAETLIAESAAQMAAETDSVAHQNEADLLDTVDIITVDRLSQSTAPPANFAFGGGSVTDCTTGFLVQNSNGTFGLTTAGHCQDNQAFYGTNLPFVSGSDSGSLDVQWHTIGSLTPTSQINTSPNYNRWRQISGTVRRAQQVNGTFVCKYGKTTQATCGTVNSNNVRPNYIKNANPTFMRVKTTDGSRMTQGGDSGGPYYFDNLAYGTQSGDGGFFVDEGIYMAIDYFDTLGVRVVTW